MKKAIVLLAMLGASFAHADIKKVEASYKACGEKAETTMAYLECSGEAYKAADAELNKVYANIKKAHGADEDSQINKDNQEITKRLVASQRAWLTFRDANCSLQGTQMLGGSGENIAISGCRAQTTIDRVKELQSLFEQL